MIDDFKNIPNKVNLEQFDISSFAKDKIRDLFRTGKVPTAEVMVDEILLRAVKSEATDIHFEPTDGELRVRYGSEGVLKKLVSLPREISDNLANVLKTKGALNAFEKKKPQDGRFSLNIGLHQFDIRISTIPVMFGERIALRILEKTARVTSLDELGFTPENLTKVRNLLHRPHGLFIVTGPSGSGKTTTAYAGVNDIQGVEKNIFTVENPVEYRLDFASQVSTSSDKSFTYVDALRAILRQNPNIIMLGEIREAETGIVAAEAALTGNLVLSTILSDSAIGAIFRLINIGVPPYWLASTLLGVVYQQLVRKICASCKEEYQPTDANETPFVSMLAGEAKYYRGKGCEKCDNSGYYGRTAIQEVLVLNDQMRDLIYQHASIMKIKDAARTTGFESAFQDGISKVKAGVTTISEFYRALG